MIGRALCERYGLPESQVLDTFELTRAAGILPTIFTHDGTSNTEGRHFRRLDRSKRAYRDKRVLLLCRDPRDTVISCFFEATRRKGVYAGTLSEFLRDPHYGIEKIVTFYELWDAARSVPEEMLIVSYEGLHADPGKVLRETLAFMGASDLPERSVTDAIEYGRFDNMRRMEQAGRPRRGLAPAPRRRERRELLQDAQGQGGRLRGDALGGGSRLRESRARRARVSAARGLPELSAGEARSVYRASIVLVLRSAAGWLAASPWPRTPKSRRPRTPTFRRRRRRRLRLRSEFEDETACASTSSIRRPAP